MTDRGGPIAEGREDLVAPGPPPGWYPDPANNDFVRWWSGQHWTNYAGPKPLPPEPIVEKRPWWRWILYLAAIVLAGLIPMVIGVILWANPTYRRVGRITVYLSSAVIVLIALLFVLGALID